MISSDPQFTEQNVRFTSISVKASRYPSFFFEHWLFSIVEVVFLQSYLAIETIEEIARFNDMKS